MVVGLEANRKIKIFDMELIGKIEEIRQLTQRTATFSVREFVLEVENQNNSQWNDHILLQTTNNNCALLDNFSVGQTVKVQFDIRGRRWQGNDGTERVFNTLSAWRIEAVDTQATTQTAAQQPQAAAPQSYQAAPQQPASQVSEPAAGSQTNAPVDDLPF